MTAKLHLFGDSINTDIIIAGTYLGHSDPEILAKHAFQAVRPDFYRHVSRGDVLVAGEDFGSGSSREQAAIAVKGLGVSCVVAKSVARIFYRSAINIALPVLIAPQAVDAAIDGAPIHVDLERSLIRTNNGVFQAEPLSAHIQKILKDGGLLAQMRTRVADQHKPRVTT
ncbi:3-isopropylmalate dehydratase small subunit [Leisingera sp.]|uniref:LeuD/DmdB family oxidoreductase small subunit n=1 Tax=Leisingera sp. TaxID=1879318 RepID=UPI003A9396FB